MENTSSFELNVAREIVNIGLQKAAESLSFFMKEKIQLSETNYGFNPSPGALEFSEKKGENIHLLVTEIIGQMKGICCLIFSEQEANQLRQTALPPEILNNQAIMAEMKDGILLEVDNIISASVITQFSNILKHKMHGGVPSLKVVNNSELNDFIKTKLQQQLLVISFNAHFESSSLDFTPQFLWLFDNSFSEIIKNFAHSTDNTLLLKM